MRRIAAVLLALIGCGGASGGAKAPATSEPSGAGRAGAAADDAAARAAAGPPVQLDCGDFTTCAVAKSGEVRCWGRDTTGELGDGGGGDHPRGVAVGGVAKATQIALGSQFACALTEDKKVKCWGTGRIANDGKAMKGARVIDVAGVSGVAEIAASGVIACARSDAAITCWGADAATIGSPPAGSFVQLATGFTHGCALDKNGAVTCWGTGDWGAKGAFAKPPITGASYVVTGDRHGCVVAKDKKVLCWGQNDAGQLGTKPDGDAHKKPVEVPGVRDAVRLTAGEASTCAILQSGSARCWGANPEGELGLGKRSSDERPAQLTVSDVASVCLATSHGCALAKSGKVYCWGANMHGQLGDGSKERRLSPATVAW